MSLIEMLHLVKNYKLQTKWPTNYTNYHELEYPLIKSFCRGIKE